VPTTLRPAVLANAFTPAAIPRFVEKSLVLP
jgi:hypothetical protein